MRNSLNLIGSMAAMALVVGSAANADTIQDVNFTYSDPGQGNLTASGTLVIDVTTGQALSGTGTINSSLFVNPGTVAGTQTPIGTMSMNLVTWANCASTSTNCAQPPGGGGSYPPGAFQWSDSDGTDLSADTNFSLAAPYVSPYISESDPRLSFGGLLFAITAPSTHGADTYDSFEFSAISTSVYGDFLGAGGASYAQGGSQVFSAGESGTLTITPVPLPATAWLLLSAIVGGCGVVRRGKSATV